MEEIKSKIISEEMKESYLDYSMSVIVGRALPDVKDGLKPVHRRILFSMYNMGLASNKPFVKSARIVGDCFKYHPHGDAALYDSLVRMAQDFSLRYPLVSGHGNFGSLDFPEPAQMRYTEARLSKISEEVLNDLDKETVDFVPNFDGSLEEPIVLPTKLPNLLVNGSSGIAVGMATNVPPHNISEVCNALIAFIDDHEIDVNDLLKHIKGPDFPTGGIIQGLMGVRQAYKTGRGKVIVRAKTEIEKNKIIVTEIPYQVNKSTLIENIAELVKDKKIDGITNIRDESDRTGMRIVIETRSNTQPEVILNQLYQHTQLQSSFGIIMLALVNNQPKILPLKDLLDEFVKFRIEVVTRRTKFELRKAEEKMHVLEGLIVALKNIDAVIKLIKGSKDGNEAKNGLIRYYNLTDIQAQSILDMKLQRLTSLEQGKINDEHKKLSEFTKECREILESSSRVLDIIKSELISIKNQYGDSRRTDIFEFEDDITTEDLIEDEEVVITLTNTGYIKRLPLDNYKAQKRGGKGVQATGMKEDDFVQDILITRTHTNLLFFTNKGKVHWLRSFMVPEGSRYAKGTSVVNLLSLDDKEVVRSIIAVDAFIDGAYLLFCTKRGIVKKTELKEYANPRKGGIIAINLRGNDDLIDVKMTDGCKEVMIATKDGRAVRFNESDISIVGRNSIGVRGINVKTSEVIGMEIASDGTYVLTVTENGYGKLTEISDYRLINRGGSGVINIKITEKNGKVVGIKVVDDGEEVMFITKGGMLVRTPVFGISKVGRNTQGVKLMKLDKDDSIVGLGKIAKEVD
jgi:DNA gyrase subunit A